jgi:beta-galactosidase
MHGSVEKRVIPLDRGWLFGGKLVPDAAAPTFNDASFVRVDLPHTVTPLSWHDWNPTAWEDVWIYRRHFSVPPAWRGSRLFVHFDRVLAGATPVVNGHSLDAHLGGFLPFEREITGMTQERDNVVAVEVDARWLDVPPSGNPRGPSSVDYLLPGGITGGVELRAVPQVFLREIYAKPVDVLSPGRHLEISCRLDAAGQLPARVRLAATLQKNGRTAATVSQSFQVEKPDQELELRMEHLGDIELWHVDHPHLYTVEVTLLLDEKPVHRCSTRIGFRDARFELGGFFLNGKRLQIFGLDRHELYPYLGFAAPSRLLRRDAEILRRQFNCNAVRCSHYPQSEAFLDACDELGLMVWEELPGWGYIGDASWQELAYRDVGAMVLRDRNHPSIVIWGVRVNESHNDPDLYKRTRALADSLDGTRATSGTMTGGSRKTWQTEWAQDVFAFDDYHSAPDGTVGIDPPVEGFPYLITETVGQFDYPAHKGFDVRYRRAGDMVQQTDQAIFHAQAHSRAAENPRISGTIAWCAFDYASLINATNAIKCPGIADVFRLNKLGASFYLAQTDPAVRPVIEPDFYWDFGPKTPGGPGEHAAIFSNCERLELFIDGKPHATVHPDRTRYPNLKAPPFFANLEMDGSKHPELRIDGYMGEARVLSRSFSDDASTDRLWLHADDDELNADGSDATRLAFAIVDKFGAPRAFAEGSVSLQIEGPGILIGDNPFSLAENGGAGAVYVRTLPGRAGTIRVSARCGTHTASAEIQVRA